jgi:hypothetical protein
MGPRVLAYKAGLNRETVWSILHGARERFSVWSVVRIAVALGVSVDYLVGLTDDSERITDSNLPVYPREGR